MNWYINFPTFQYNEDVKALAKEKGLKIVDAKFQGKNKQCADAPELTVIGEVKPKRARKAK